MHNHNSFDGAYYPENASFLSKSIYNYFTNIDRSSKETNVSNIISEIKKSNSFTFLVPHGSHYFSGVVSSYAYYIISKINCDNFIIVSTDHNGTSPGISTIDSEYWITPFGNIQINKEILQSLIKASDGFVAVDPLSFKIDRTIDVQLPFLQTIKKNALTILPILLSDQGKLNCIKLANILYSITSSVKNIILIFTSNLSHYLNYERCIAIDHMIIADIIKMDLDLYYSKLDPTFNVCGYGSIGTFITFSSFHKSCKTSLLKYQNSGDVDGNRSSVVGYASMISI